MNLMNIGLAGLNTSQSALNVAAQNVANVNTPGYSRQQVMIKATGSDDNLSPGGGAQVIGIRRIADQFLIQQSWSSASESSYTSSYLNNMTSLENLLGADGFNLNSGLNSLNSALSSATLKPASIPFRQQVINEAESLSQRFNTLSQSLHAQNEDISKHRETTIENANSLLKNIAKINSKIAETNGSGSNANLIDERDNLIGQLSQVVEIRSNTNSNGSLQISLASGQPLVLGSDAAQLKTTDNQHDPFIKTVSIDFAGQDFPITGDLGGQLGALSDYQLSVLKPYHEAINDMAVSVAERFNDVLKQGKDLNGNTGKALFEFDANSPAASLKVTDLKPDELAFSSNGDVGNSDVLNDLINIADETFAISGFGNVTLNDGFISMVGEVAIKTRQASSDNKAADTMFKQAQAARDNLSAVNSDEEAANVMMFSNAYQANMKVISTANQLFDTVLQLF